MIEFALGILLWFVMWPTLVILSLLAIWTEVEGGHKSQLLFTLLAGLVAWQLFEVPLELLVKLAIVWIPVGICWSIFRWKLHCADVVANKRQHGSGTQIRMLTMSENVEKIVAWVLGWPASMLSRVLGDIIRVVRIAVTEWIGEVYRRIAQPYLDQIKDK